MCGEDETTPSLNPLWMGWADAAIEAPSEGPIPKEWPSVASMKALLRAAGEKWDSGGLQPPARGGLLLPPGYGDDGIETPDQAVERLCLDWRQNLRSGLTERNQPDLHPSAQADLRLFLETGKSGAGGEALPLAIRVLILPRNRVFGTHAHPTIELELTLRGSLGEVRLVSADPGGALPVPHRGPWEPRPGGGGSAGTEPGRPRRAALPPPPAGTVEGDEARRGRKVPVQRGRIHPQIVHRSRGWCVHGPLGGNSRHHLPRRGGELHPELGPTGPEARDQRGGLTRSS